MYSRFDIQGAGPRPGRAGPWGGVSRAALYILARYCVRVAQAERTDTECCNRASIVQATESACTVRILHGILTESVLQHRGLVQNMDSGLWTGLMDWTHGLDSWTGLMDWTHGLDCGLRFGLDFGLIRSSMTTISNHKVPWRPDIC